MYYRCRCLKVLSPLADNCVYLLQQLQLHVWMLFEQQQHEEEADGQSVWCCDHHLQHTLPHILCRQFAVVLKTHTSTSGLEEVLSIYKKKKEERKWCLFNSQTDLCEYELCSEVDVVQFISLLHISPLLFDKTLYGILQLLAGR